MYFIGFLGWGIGPQQRFYLHTTRYRKTLTHINASSGFGISKIIIIMATTQFRQLNLFYQHAALPDVTNKYHDL